MLESLESRRLLSVTLEDGVLTVTGTDQDDMIGVSRSTTMIVVNDNGTTSEWDPALVQSILVNALEGNDQVAVLRPMGKPLVVNGGAGDDALRGGAGRERLNGDAGNDKIFGGGGGDYLTGGEDNDTIVGGAGPDIMLGNAGNDRFDAFDHDHDRIDGGDGIDGARVNHGDRVHHVEHVFVGPRPRGAFDDGSDEVSSGDKLEDIVNQTA